MKQISVDVSRLNAGEPDCIDVRRGPENELWRGCRVDVPAESSIRYETGRPHRVWLETMGPVTVHGKDGSSVVVA